LPDRARHRLSQETLNEVLMPEVLATFTPSHRVQHVGTGRDHASDRAEPINHPSNTCCIKPATGTPAAAEASALRKRSKATP
jgi:hypothetical protein